MTKTSAVVISMVLAASVGLTGCGSDKRIECDAEDYVSQDTDCGYTNQAGQWIYYNWTKPNETTYSPEGWEPPAEAGVEEDGNGKLKKKSKKP